MEVLVCSDGTVTLREAGLYDSVGNMVSTWNELLDNGDITLSGTTITESNEYLTGELIIPEGITEIGGYAFMDLSTTSVMIPASVVEIGEYAFFDANIEKMFFASESQLTTIGESAFQDVYIESVEIPASVTSIGMYAFQVNTLETIIFRGKISEWNAITKEHYWNDLVPATEVICSDGRVSL